MNQPANSGGFKGKRKHQHFIIINAVLSATVFSILGVLLWLQSSRQLPQKCTLPISISNWLIRQRIFFPEDLLCLHYFDSHLFPHRLTNFYSAKKIRAKKIKNTLFFVRKRSVFVYKMYSPIFFVII